MPKSCIALVLSFMILTAPISMAQNGQYKPGEFIVQFAKDVDPHQTMTRFQRGASNESMRMGKCLSQQMNIWIAKFDPETTNENDLLHELRNHPKTTEVQRNHILERRVKTPGDQHYVEQWYIHNDGSTGGSSDADIDADEAWDITTGGLTTLGDTIVIASLDVGVDFDHPDLKENIWKNIHEIPDNGMDDDNNGYVDDYWGWNVIDENDDISPVELSPGIEESHGTEILGVMGAVGNNRIGIAGVNWNVKLLNISINSDLNEADMIAAYNYVLRMRQLYNETGGARGAYIVATTISYGDEDLSPEDSPLWCGIYDELGAAGVLSCAATANEELDIDEIKDVPTSCASDYMVAVTASNRSDERDFAAYGKNDIDIAAPGSSIFTTSIPDYDSPTGTSYATPLVAATIGLLYSSPCADLATLATHDPSQAALMAKSLIMESVDTISSLKDEIVSGGRLNVFSAINATMNQCQSCISPFDVQVVESGAQSAIISWSVEDSVGSTNLRYRTAGDTVWQQIDSVDSPVTIDGLSFCTTYELQLENICDDLSMAISNISIFGTDSCCVAPEVDITPSSETTVHLTLTEQGETEGYLLLLAKVSDSLVWDSSLIEAGTDLYVIDNLDTCSEYQIQIFSFCDEIVATDVLSFMALGCGTCLDSVYCIPDIDAVGDEWIEHLQLSTIDNLSGYDEGYGDYTGASIQLKQGNAYDLKISPGYANDSMPEKYFAWIDYNQDGTFTEDELAYESEDSIIGTLEDALYIPMDAPLGDTRIRFLMLHNPLDIPSGCETAIDLGEAEDYCIEIVIDSLLCDLPQNLDTLMVTPGTAVISWDRIDSALAYIIRHRNINEEEWEEVVDTATMYALSMLEDCNTYEVQVQAVCARDTSGYTESLTFVAHCDTDVDDVLVDVGIEVFPNPFSSGLSVKIDAVDSDSGQIIVQQSNGLVIQSQSARWRSGPNLITVRGVDDLPSGMYLLTLQSSKGRIVKKLIKY